jgi:hypothetical protein
VSAAALSPTPLSFAQDRFDNLVSKIGLAASAPAGDKLSALRSLTPNTLNQLHGDGVSPPVWDPDFWSDYEQGTSLSDTSRPLPSWLKSAVIGCTSEEAALFLPSHISGTDAVAMVKHAFAVDPDLTQDILNAYTIKEAMSSSDATNALIRLVTHGVFTNVAHTFATSYHETPISYYSFNQVDPFPQSNWHNRAFHSLGNSMLFHLPTVAGPNADAGTRATSDRFCEAAIRLTNGEQPWESYSTGRKQMVLDGEKSDLVQVDDSAAVWEKFCTSKERLDAFCQGAIALVRDAILMANAKAKRDEQT